MPESATASVGRTDTRPDALVLADRVAWRPSRVAIVVDAVMLCAVLALTAAFRGAELSAWHAFFAVMAVATMAGRGAYSRRMEDSVAVALFRHVVASVLFAIMATVTARSVVEDQTTSTRGLMVVATFSVLGLACSRALSVHVERRRRAAGAGVLRTMVLGSDVAASSIADRLRRRPEIGLRPVGFLAQSRSGSPAALVAGGVRLPVLGGAGDLDDVINRHRIDAVIVAALDDEEADNAWTTQVVERVHERQLTVFVLPRLYEVINTRTKRHRLGTMSLDELRPVDPRSRAFHAKYALDRVLGTIATIAFLPVLIAIAAAVKLSSPGPVLFRQRRVGLDGRQFDILKFRSMRMPEPTLTLSPVTWQPNAGTAPGGVEGEDRRTRVGKFLRSSNLDELPQLMNIAMGDMCIVGPRPERPEFVERFREEFKAYDARHRVKAGLTGWSQVNGLRGKTSIGERADWDNYYIENWSFALDFAIIVQTFKTFLESNE